MRANERVSERICENGWKEGEERGQLDRVGWVGKREGAKGQQPLRAMTHLWLGGGGGGGGGRSFWLQI